jgi:hypothetical protein
MRRAEIIFPSALIVIIAALLASGWALGYSWAVLGFPFATGVAICVLCLVIIVTTLAGRPTATGAAPAADATPIDASSVAWIAALGAAVYALGFVVGPAAYLLAYLRASGYSWPLTLSVSAASVAVTWGVFINALQILLPVEPLWWW